MFNTIILKKGNARLSQNEYKKFQKGDTIFGENSDPEEIKKVEFRTGTRSEK